MSLEMLGAVPTDDEVAKTRVRDAVRFLVTTGGIVAGVMLWPAHRVVGGILGFLVGGAVSTIATSGQEDSITRAYRAASGGPA